MTRIAAASLQLESNSLSPIVMRLGDFDLAYGEAMLEKVHISGMAREANVEIFPLLYAHALPGGAMGKADFLKLAGDIVKGMPKNIDGLWLYLHGSLYVKEIGSGETWLLKRIREKIGFDIPVSAALDFHANNTDDFASLCNCICGFRTVPHKDQIETELKTLSLLFACIKQRLLPKPHIARPYVIAPGDCVQTALPPLSAIMARADEIEEQDEVLCAQVFGGQPWVDAPFMGPSTVVTCKTDEKAAAGYAEELSAMYYQARHDFKFLTKTASAGEAIKLAMEAKEDTVFLSDSGDNTTAGAPGDNAFLLNRLFERGAQKVLLAGITDEKACLACFEAAVGSSLTLKIGASLDKHSESSVIRGTLRSRGDALGYTGVVTGKAAVLDCNGITVVITEKRTAFTGREAFELIGLNPLDFKIVVVKLGYLFPDLAAISRRSILVLTPGASPERLEDMGHKNIHRPMYPLDDNFRR
jgi:microcystin degradation protein MlrC